MSEAHIVEIAICPNTMKILQANSGRQASKDLQPGQESPFISGILENVTRILKDRGVKFTKDPDGPSPN